MGHKERIEVPGSEVFGPYSPGVKSYGIVWLAGQIAPDAGDDVVSQTAGALGKVDALLKDKCNVLSRASQQPNKGSQTVR